MGTISYTIPTAGSTLNSIADPQIATALQTLLTWANGNIDAINLSNALAQSAGVNESGQTVKGVSNIATSQSTSSTSFTALATPDQVTGITLPTNGLIAVWYWATWQESVRGAASADIFLGANEIKSVAPGTNTAAANPAVINNSINVNYALSSFPGGLVSGNTATNFGATPYGGDATTGQTVGFNWAATDSTYWPGGPCYLFAAAGTYTVSVQFKASSGSVTASNRKLWVQAVSFS